MPAPMKIVLAILTCPPSLWQCRPWRAPDYSSGRGGFDILEQRIDRGRPAGGVGACPAIGTETAPPPPLCFFSQAADRASGQRRAGALGDRVAGAENPRRPGIVAFERRGGGERDQGVHEREFVVQLAAAGEALAHEPDRRVWV